MTILNENAIEQDLIEQLKTLGYDYYHGSTLERSLDAVVLEQELKVALKRLNPDLPQSARAEALNHILNLGSDDIMTNNEKFHAMLSDGITVEYFKDGNTVGLQVKLVDFGVPDNNSFWAVNQFVIKENNVSKRLDVVLFVNGLPLVVIELKSAVSEKATLERAFTQIQNYKTAIPSLFFYNALCIVSDGVDARTSSLSAPFSRFLAWKSPEKSENGQLSELQILTERMLQKPVLLKLIRFNTVFEAEEQKDADTGLVFQVKIKKIAAYHQYYLVEKAIEETLRATSEQGDRRIGVAWHTQGSGKSLSMVFYAGRMVVEPEMKTRPLLF